MQIVKFTAADIDTPVTSFRAEDVTTGVPGLLAPGNIDLAKQPKVKNPNGSISTVDSSSYNIDGKEVLLPSVTPDGRHLSNAKDIVAEYKKTGRHLGIFADADSATQYAQQLHEDYAAGKYDAPTLGAHPEAVMRAPTTADPVTLGELIDNPIEAIQRIGSILKQDATDPKTWMTLATAYFGPKVMSVVRPAVGNAFNAVLPSRATVGKGFSIAGGVMESPIAGAVSPRAAHVGRMISAVGEQLQVPRAAAPQAPTPVAPVPQQPGPVRPPIQVMPPAEPAPAAGDLNAALAARSQAAPPFNPGHAFKAVKAVFEDLKVTPRGTEVSTAMMKMRQGLDPAAAVQEVLATRPTVPKSAAEDLAQRLGMPSDAEVEATVAAQNAKTTRSRGGTK